MQDLRDLPAGLALGNESQDLPFGSRESVGIVLICGGLAVEIILEEQARDRRGTAGGAQLGEGRQCRVEPDGDLLIIASGRSLMKFNRNCS
jgi:hypothetical protein